MQAFDLTTFITSNKDGSVGRWLCPVPGCGKLAAPPDLYTSTWLNNASLEHPYVLLVLFLFPTSSNDTNIYRDSKTISVGEAEPDVEMEDVKPKLN